MSMLTLYVATPLTGAVMRNQSEIHVWRAMADDAAFVGVGLVVVVREEEGLASPDQRAVSSHVPFAHARANAPVRARLRRRARAQEAGRVDERVEQKRAVSAIDTRTPVSQPSHHFLA